MPKVQDRRLPEPDSPEIRQLFPLESVRQIYGFLYERRDSPPTTDEIHAFVADLSGAQSEAIRRLRSIRDCFVVQRTQTGRIHRYRLLGWKADAPDAMRGALSRATRARILAPQRCAQCGRTPLGDEVKLHVDHKIPISWGGENDDDNLQPLCEECNLGKRDFYATYESYSDAIRNATRHDEPHGRIGELLKALEGEWVPSDLISIVASMRQHQDDWQRRLRELKDLGWVYHNRVTRPADSRRAFSEYRLIEWTPWPEGSIRSAIEEGKRRKRAREDD
ncbi:HNH endonuclease signature motif containing protein [Streptomyces virginiae]|uniref:HNH endonuclease n=1 Tax=Streptomyces virginiae TaxID=1961 RepID=UPI00341FE550